MKPSAIIGIVLILAGILLLAYQGFSYKTREKAVDLGPLQITTERTHYVPVPAIAGVLVLVGGIALVFRGVR